MQSHREFTAGEIRRLLRALIGEGPNQCTQSVLAQRIGVSDAYLSMVLNGRVPTGRILEFFELKRVIVYRPTSLDE